MLRGLPMAEKEQVEDWRLRFRLERKIHFVGGRTTEVKKRAKNYLD